MKYCFHHSLTRLNSSGESILNPSKLSPDWTWLESRPTYWDRGTMRRWRHDVFSVLCEEFTGYYDDKYVAIEPSKNMTCKHAPLKSWLEKIPYLLLDISIVVMPELVLAFFTSVVAWWSWRGLQVSKEVVLELVWLALN